MPSIIPPDPGPFSYDTVHSRDEVAQGRVKFIVVILTLGLLWVLDFVAQPFLLVPGFLVSWNLALMFGTKVVILILTAVFVLLTWAGFGWVRYAFAVYLLLCGLSTLILSMELGAEWGFGPLMLSVGELGGAAMLAMSIGILRFVEAQRKKGFPWLVLAVTIMATFSSLLIVGAVDLGTLQVNLANDQAKTRLVNDVMERFAPEMDISKMSDLGNSDFQRKMQVNNFSDFRALFGAYQGFDDEEGPTWNGMGTLRRSRDESPVYCIMAHYAKADAIITIELKGHGTQARVADLFAQQIRHSRPTDAISPAVTRESSRATKSSR